MEELHAVFKDEIYKKTSNNPRLRQAVRGIMLDKDNRVALIHIKGIDKFGYRNHYELPGGGIDEDEDDITALKREMHEEIGYLIADIIPVGIIGIEYNILERIDYQHYYLGKLKQFIGQDLIDYEKDLFTEVIFVKIDELVSFYQNHQTEGIGKVIHERDFFAMKKCFNL